MASSNPNQHNETQASLKLTVQSETKRMKLEEKEAPNEVAKTKQISLNKFQLLPNNNEYYIGVIRILGSNEFRITMLNGNNCWISKPETFENLLNKNKNKLNQNINQFRNNLICALTKPNNNNYEINEINVEKNKNKSNNYNYKQIEIYYKLDGLKYKLSNFKLFQGKKNLFYVFEKLEHSVNEKRKESEKYRRDNIKFQNTYNQQMKQLDKEINDKNQMENELLSKFVILLNEKKKKIRVLQNELLQLKDEKNVSNNSDNNNTDWDMIDSDHSQMDTDTL